MQQQTHQHLSKGLVLFKRNFASSTNPPKLKDRLSHRPLVTFSDLFKRCTLLRSSFCIHNAPFAHLQHRANKTKHVHIWNGKVVRSNWF